MRQHPMNFQDQGAMASLKSANVALAAAKEATPAEYRDMLRGVIQFRDGWYEWHWQVR